MAERRILSRLLDAFSGRGGIRSQRRGAAETLNQILNRKGGGSARQVTVSDPYREVPAVYRSSNVVKAAFVEGVQELRILGGVERSLKDDEVVKRGAAKGHILEALNLFERPITMEPENGNERVLLSGRRLRQMVTIQAMIHSAAHVLATPGRITGMPWRFVPTIPGTITPKVAEDDPYTLVCWEFRMRGRAPIPLRVEDVVSIPFAPDPYDIFSGVAPVEPASDAINTSKAVSVFRRSAMSNSGMQGFVSIDLGDPQANANGLTNEQATEIKRRLYEENMGPANAEKVALLTGRASFTPVGPSTAREMQLDKTTKEALEEVVRTSGVPLALMGIHDHSALSRATIMAEKGFLYDYAVKDFAGSYDEQMTVFARRFDERLYIYTNFDNVDALKEDADARWERARKAIEQGVSPWEANRLFDLGREDLSDENGEPLPHALQSYLPAGLMPAEMVMAGAGAIVAPSLAGPPAQHDRPEPESDPPKLPLEERKEAREIVAQVNAGTLPRDSGIALLVAIGMTEGEAEAFMGSAGRASQDDPEPNDAAKSSAARGAILDRSRAAATAPQPASSATRDQVRDAQWRAFDKKVRPFEDKIEAKLRKHLNRVRAQILKSITPTDPDTPPEEQVERAVGGLFVSENAAAIAREVEDFYGFDDALAFTILESESAVARGLQDRMTRGADDSSKLFDPRAFAELIRSIVQMAFTAGAFGANRELIDIGITDDSVLEADKDRIPKIASNYFDKRLGMMVRIGDSIKAEVHSTLLEGYKEGEALGKLKDRVKGVFKVSLQRARVIARTETGISVNAGRHDALKTNDPGGVHEWLSARDSVVRHSHREIDGERRKIGEKFSNGLLHAQDPTGPAKEVVSCRCTNAAVSEALEAFEAETAIAASVDVTNEYVMLRTSAQNLARRAVHLGVECPTPSIARHVPSALAEKLRGESTGGSTPDALLRSHLDGGGLDNAAVSGALRTLGGTLFVTEWARAFGQDIGHELAA